MINTNIRKKVLGLAVACALLGGSVAVPFAASASQLDDPEDAAYVERTAVADSAKAKAEAPTVEQLAASAPTSVRLTDRKATSEAVSLFQYLSALSANNYVMYGHQNDTYHKMFLVKEGTESDTKDVTGVLPAMLGVDSLAMTGAELHLTPKERNNGVTYVDKLTTISQKAVQEGAIITLSMHLPNFAQVAKRPKIDGKYDFSGYSPNDVSGEVGSRILPDGDLNEVYNSYLDMIAEYALNLQAQNVPIIFRPLHEHNGHWFWWGKGHIEEGDYIALWQYTVKYLRDEKGVHNMLYAFSPNGPCLDEESYLYGYPGDRYVDILGLDLYDDKQDDKWKGDLKKSLTVIGAKAKATGKVLALTETGVRKGGSLTITGNRDKKWFGNVAEIASQCGAAYMLTWANFAKMEHNFFSPYMVSETRGHEMVNEFVDFYNMPKTIFADGVCDFTKLPAPQVSGR